MPHLFRSLRLAVVSVLLVTLVTGCVRSPVEGDGARWEPLATLTFGCPNLKGTYALKGGGLPLSQTAFGRFARSSGLRFPWETMTIAGDADDSLVVTLARSQRQREAYRDFVFARGEYDERQYRRMHTPEVRWSSGFATMTDAEYEENLEKLYLAPTRTHTLHRGADYTCRGGWLRLERVVHDPGPDRNNPRPDTVIGEVHLRKGWTGDLAARSEFEEAKELTIWCGDGCKGIPLGAWTTHQWGRWRRAMPASDGMVPRPWAEPFAPPPVSRSTSPATTPPADIARALRAMLPPGAQLTSVAYDRDGYRAIVASSNTPPFTALLATLRRAYRFRGERVLGITRSPGGEWEMALGIGDLWTDSPANPRDPTRAAWESLPSAVKLVGSRGGVQKGLELTLVSTVQPAMDEAVRAIARRQEYDSVAVISSIRARGDEIVTRVYVRERARR